MARTACPRCGSFNEEAAVFCDQCGSPLKGVAPPRGRARVLWFGGAALVAAAAAVLFLRGGAETPPPVVPGVAAPAAGTGARGSEPAGVQRPPSDPGVAVAPPLESTVLTTEAPAAAIEEEGPVRWVVVVGRDEAGRASFSFPGVVLEGGVVLCAVEALASPAAALQIMWSAGSLSVAETVGWDLERGYCLLPFSEEGSGFAVGAVVPGEEVVLASSDRHKVSAVVEELRAYGLERLPIFAVKTAPEAGFLLDGEAVAGVAWYTRGLAEVQLFGSVAGYRLTRGMAVAAWREQVWEGSPYEAFCAGRRAFASGEWAAAARAFGEAIRKRADFRALLTGPLMSEALAAAYLKWAGESGARGDFEEACAVLAEGLRLLPASKELLLMLAREEAALGRLEAALEHTRAALALDDDLWTRRWPLLEERYLQLAAALKTAEAIAILAEGAEDLPASVNLRAELGAVLFKERRWTEALAAWEEAYAIRADPDLAALIEEARRRLAAERDVVSIPLGDGHGTIRTVVRCNGRLDVPCILDTGATYTALPSWAAVQLGFALQNASRVRIATASGVTEAPVITLDAVALGPLSVGPLDALVLDLPHNPGESPVGILGLNFLKHFNVLMDRERKELRIAPK